VQGVDDHGTIVTDAQDGPRKPMRLTARPDVHRWRAYLA
jgi:hypothetical protein